MNQAAWIKWVEFYPKCVEQFTSQETKSLSSALSDKDEAGSDDPPEVISNLSYSMILDCMKSSCQQGYP